LIRRHPGCGVALDVFNRLKAFLNGQIDILRRHIILEIDKRLVADGLTVCRHLTHRLKAC